MNQLTRLSAVIVSGVVSGGAALAQSSGNARIANVTFELVDLDLADATTPLLCFYSDLPGPAAVWEIHDEHTGQLTADSNTGSAPLGPLAVSEVLGDEPHTRSALAAGISGATLADKQLPTPLT